MWWPIGAARVEHASARNSSRALPTHHVRRARGPPAPNPPVLDLGLHPCTTPQAASQRISQCRSMHSMMSTAPKAAQPLCGREAGAGFSLAPRPALARPHAGLSRPAPFRGTRLVVTSVSAPEKANSTTPAAETTKPPFTAWDTAVQRVAKRTDIKSVLVLGAGPIVIGQVRPGQGFAGVGALGRIFGAQTLEAQCSPCRASLAPNRPASSTTLGPRRARLSSRPGVRGRLLGVWQAILRHAGQMEVRGGAQDLAFCMLP